MTKKSLIDQINNAYDYLSDNYMSPHILISNGDKTMFPPHLQEQKVVLFNVDFEAVGKFNLDEDGFSVEMRFGGKPFTIYCPLENIVLLQSKLGNVIFKIIEDPFVVIPISKPNIQTKSRLPEGLLKVDAPKTDLKLVIGGNLGNGIPSAKLSLV